MSKKDCRDCELERRRHGAAAGLCHRCSAKHYPNDPQLSLRVPDLGLKLRDEVAEESAS